MGVGCGVWGMGCGVWGVGCGVWGVGCRVWNVGFAVQGILCGQWGLRFGFRFSSLGLEFRVRDLGFQDPGIQYWVSVLSVGVLDFGFWVSGVVCRFADSGFWVWGSRFHVSVIGSRNSGFRFRGSYLRFRFDTAGMFCASGSCLCALYCACFRFWLQHLGVWVQGVDFHKKHCPKA